MVRKNKVRHEQAATLNKLANILARLGVCHNLTPITIAANDLNDETRPIPIPKECKFADNRNAWGYRIDKLMFKSNSSPKKTRPRENAPLEIECNIHLVGDMNDFNESDLDPLKHLEFELLFKQGKSKSSMHLDRHLESDGDSKPKEIHPNYHFQYWGYEMKDIENIGDVLLLEPPRMPHYPMDIVLGVDFIVSNFIPDKWKELMNDGGYLGLLRESQKKFLMQYYSVIVNNGKLARKMLPQLQITKPI